MASKIKVDQLETADGSGTIALQNQLSGMTTASLPALGSAQMPTGSVIQVVKYTGAVETATTSNNTWVATAANVTITPSSTSSKIYLSHTAGGLLQSPSVGQSFGLRIKRAISGGATSYPYSSDRYHYMAAGEDWVGTNWAVIELDSPSTTSAITYTIEFKKSASSGELRHCDTATWNFVAMEVQG